jgi:hydroxypyruvate isomerase
MPRFAANLSWMYAELPFEERFAAAAADGFAGVECQFPYAWPAAELAARRADAGVEQVLINMPAGDAAAGERGLGCLPGRQDDFRRALAEQALPYAQALGCRRVHVMAGVGPPAAERAALLDVFAANLQWAAAQALSAGMQVLIEPINARDVPGYFLNRQDQAHELAALVGAPNLAVQMDLYHCQIVEGDLSTKLRHYLDPARATRVGHLQIAGVPARHEPDEGEVRYSYLFDLIDRLGWTGWVGAEYRPRGATRQGLGWFAPYRAGWARHGAAGPTS